MPLLPWWELKPERLEWEYAWLTQEGYKYEEISRDELDGTLEVQVEFPIDGKVLNLQVTFPPFFPDSRYQVRCADLKLPHHQNPFSNELCLLGRSTALWDPTVALAQFLKEQMPLLLKAGTTDDRSKADGIEDHQAEPVGAFLPFMGESGLLIDENFELGTKSEGEFNADVKITFVKDQLSVKGIITSLDGKQFWTPESDVVLHQLGFCKRISGRWYNISSFPPGLNAAEFVLLAQKDNPDLAKTKFDFELNHHLCELLAFHVPSETGHREIGREWLMVIRLTPRFGPRKARLPCCGYVRLKPFGRKLLYRRAPELHPLATKRIAVIGLGCIGAPAAIELARAAVGELRILDPDIIDAGTVVRWPIGLPAIGTLKITSIANFISQNFPFTKVVIESRRVGGITTNGGNGIGLYKIEEFLKDVDLVLDASAELGV